MTVIELFATLRELQIHVWAEGDRVRCSAPRGVLTPELQEELKRHRDEILRYLHSAANGKSSHRLHLDRIPAGEQPALSFFQERLWILSRLEPDSTAYNLVATLKMAGPLDRPRLESTLNELVARHESLRCAFREVAGAPTVVVSPQPTARPAFADLTHLGTAEQEIELGRIVGAEAATPFRLEQGELLRVTCVGCGNDEIMLVVAMHHIITDAWSMGILLHEWQALYQAAQAGQPSPLPPAAIQFPEYAYWERRWLRESAFDDQVEYWKSKLGDAPHLLTLAMDRPRPPVQTYLGGVEGFAVPGDVGEELRVRCRDEGVTIFMALLATFNVLLQRYSGQSDMLVGSPIAIRNRAELERTIGPFVNSLVLRTQIASDDTPRSLRAKVRQTLLEGQAHQDVPFGRLVELINPERSLAYSPLFQVAFMFQNSPGRSAFTINTGGAMYDLTLNGWEIDGMIGASFEYAKALFNPETIARMGRHFVVLLGRMVREPDRRLAELPVLTGAERDEVLVRWNDTSRPYPRGETLAHLFEDQVRREPARIAVASEDASWSYEELNRKSNQLARHLKRRGIGPGSRVAVCVERSPRLLQSLLAVIKSGASYVPLDPQYPSRRIQFMLQDAQVALILSEQPARQSLGTPQAPVLGLDTDQLAVANESGDNLDLVAGAADPAYVIYTSGSTGQPKGVEVTHGGLVNLLRSMQEQPGLNQDDVLLAITTVAFDISGLELFLPLVTGARVFIASTVATQDGRRLQKLIESSASTVMQATPATWQMLIDTGWTNSGGTMAAWCGGDALGRELAEALLTRTHAVWNLYGPTETTIWSAAAAVVSGSGAVPIGRPIANTQVYVLDSYSEPVPIGAAGEIYIGGAGVAHGYLNRPELTADRFVADPFSRTPGSRIYRTGDVGRFRPDGQLEHLGRIDQQVKLRGFRIELGEIEAALTSHPAVVSAVAAVRASRLVAYVVIAPDRVLTATDARRFLREILPDYMVPMHIVPVDHFPLTANGKIDRQALPDPFSWGGDSPEIVLPETPTERRIAQLWQELLGISRLGVQQTFFDLGGHSLLAVKAAYEIEKTMGYALDIRVFFFENLRQIAARCDAMSAAGSGTHD